MGCNASVDRCQLNLTSPSASSSIDRLEGTFVVVCRSRLRLERSVRVSMVLRANVEVLSTIYGRIQVVEQSHNLWKVDADIAKRGTWLEPGETRLKFSISLGDKIQNAKQYMDPKALKVLFPDYRTVRYEYVIRAGSLQLQDIVVYPKELMKLARRTAKS